MSEMHYNYGAHTEREHALATKAEQPTITQACPFCGEHELPPIMPKTEYGEVHCQGCGARGPMREYSGQRADPLERWNTRTTSLAAQDGLVERIVRDVAELPDRTSPEDWPDAMLVTADELAAIVEAALASIEVKS